MIAESDFPELGSEVFCRTSYNRVFQTTMLKLLFENYLGIIGIPDIQSRNSSNFGEWLKKFKFERRI